MDERPEDRLALIEVLERDGRVGRALDVHRWPQTLGRGLDNTVVLDDAHVAPAHARLELDAEGRVCLSVLDCANGAQLDGHRLAAGTAAQPLPAGGAALQLGATRLRVRLRGEVLAPEKPLVSPVFRPAALAGQALLVFAVVVVRHWVQLDPGADLGAWLPLLFGVPIGLVAWCGLWALASKLFQHRFDFLGHLRLVLPWLLALEAFDLAVPHVGAMLSWPWLWQLGPPIGVLLIALLLRNHLAHVLPQHGRLVSIAAVVLTAAYGVVQLNAIHRSTDRYTRAPYMSTLPLPLLRLAPSVPPQTLVDAMAPLREQLASRVRQAKDDDTADESEGE